MGWGCGGLEFGGFGGVEIFVGCGVEPGVTMGYLCK